MAINPSAFFAESRRVQGELKCRRGVADSLVAARYLRGEIDDEMKPTPGGRPRVTTPLRTEAQILKDDYVECPVCHDANSCGDYEGPVCERCGGEGKVRC